MNCKTLATTLQAILPEQSKPRITFLAILIHALFKASTVNLAQLARFINSKVEKQSCERRCTRFLDKPIMQQTIAKIILNLIGFYQSDLQFVLSMDRTNWKFGKLNLNFLVVGLCYKGYALPLAWIDLEKQGNSNSKERKALLEQVLKLIPANRIYGFAADREFIGQDWFATLLETGVNPVIRIKANTTMRYRNMVAPALIWFDSLQPNQTLELAKARVYGIRVFVLGSLTADGELLLLVTQKRPSKAFIIYAARWNIECLFKALKSSGFNLEDTHMTDKTRLESLFGVLAIGVAWSVLVGVLLEKIKPLKVKKHGRVPVSIFKRGFETLVQILDSGVSKYVVKDVAFRLLSGT